MSLTRRSVLSLIAIGGVSLLAGCKIVPITAETEPQGFDATAYAAGVWESKALPHFTANAKPMAEVLAAIRTDLAAAGEKYGYRPATEGSPWTFIVSGTATVTAKNTKSRAGTLTVTLDGTTPPETFDIQIGPVIRGNAVRDALPFVSFKDFTNQLEFADAGKALTALSLEATAPDSAAIEPGAKVAFIGAISLNTASDKILVTLVSLKPSA